jgi:hypothetical protein
MENCAPGQPSTPEIPCIEVPQTLADIFHLDAFQSVTLGLLTIMAALAGVYIVIRGGGLILSKISGQDYQESSSRELSTVVDQDSIDSRYYRSNSYDDVIDGVEYERE